MPKDQGAREGEKCALCREEMNAGAVVCRACGAVRHTGIDFQSPQGCAMVLTVLAAIVLSFASYKLYMDLGYLKDSYQIGDWIFSRFTLTALVWIAAIIMVRKRRYRVTYVKL